MPIGIAGSGRVGQAMGRLLSEMGEPVVSIASRTAEHAGAAAAFIGGGVTPSTYAELPARASRFLICVPDEAVESVASLLEADCGLALHTCGSRGPEALDVLAGRGLFCGAIHPLQTFPTAEAGIGRLRGIAFAVAGHPQAAAWAEHIAKLLGGTALHVDTALRPLYHAAAVMASNYIVALLSAAETAISAAGVAREEALRALAPLARASLENALTLGPVAALTGPIERGDTATVAAHVEALRSAPEAVQSLYRAAGLQALELARARGLSAERAAKTDNILREWK